MTAAAGALASTCQDPGSLTALQAFGHLHTATVHQPIAWTLVLAAVEALVPLWPRARLGRFLPALSLVTLASFVPATASGLVRFAQMGPGPADWADTVLHRNLLLASAACVAGHTALRLLGRRRPRAGARWLGPGLAALAAAGVLWGSHVGGQLACSSGALGL